MTRASTVTIPVVVAYHILSQIGQHFHIFMFLLGINDLCVLYSDFV